MDVLCSGSVKHPQIPVAGCLRAEHHKVVLAVTIQVGNQRIDRVVTDRAELSCRSQFDSNWRRLLTSWWKNLIDASRSWNHIAE